MSATAFGDWNPIWRRRGVLLALGGTVATLIAVVRLSLAPIEGLIGVSGTVRVCGLPLERGTIVFRPLDPQCGRPAGGAIIAGHYAIPPRAGLVAGEYVVSITSPRVSEAIDSDAPVAPPAEELIPPEYNDRTQLLKIIKPGRNPVFDFDIPSTRRPPDGPAPN